GHPSVASKSFLITIGDRSITGLVGRDQMVGPWQVPVADCAITLDDYRGYSAQAISIGERTPVAVLNAPASGRLAVTEAITNLMAAGPVDLKRTKLSANWMAAAGAEGEDAQLYATVKATGEELCSALGLGIPVGKDSLSMRTSWQENGENKEVRSPISLVVTAFTALEDMRHAKTPLLATQGDLFLIDLGQQRLGASIFAQSFQQMGEKTADIDSPQQLINLVNLMNAAYSEQLISAYHDRSDGGTIACLAEMAFASHQGLDISIKGDLFAQLFNEEPGVIIQCSDETALRELADYYGLANRLTKIASLNNQDKIQISHDEIIVLSAVRNELQKEWSKVSYEMAKRRDFPDCAQQEFDLLDQQDQGLQIATWDKPMPEAPAIITGLRPKIAVLREQGVNGQNEMAAAFHQAGFDAVDVHSSDVLSGRQSLKDFQAMVACGGFSYGDVLGAGRGWASTIRYNQRAFDEFSAFFSRDDTISLGVCNGCQMLSQLSDMIPGAENWPTFQRNQSEQFEARSSVVRIEKSPSIFLQGMEGAMLPIAIAHGEGRVDQAQDVQVCLRYVDGEGEATEYYPLNPNGSVGGVTGVCSDDGRVTIMMPHPERVFRSVQLSWSPEGWDGYSPWMQFFINAYNTVR
ncbi:MAG: phosphoribosylformylglycinamidine synthase, partial [bacterium]